MQNFDELTSAIQSVPAGRWAVAVSGGADSVALLSLLRSRSDLTLRVVHLDHQTRRGESAKDAEFVAELAARLGLPCDCTMLDEIMPLVNGPPKNRSAMFRAARFALFRRVVAEHDLSGVILAHHADDQAETVALRLLRGSGYSGLKGMSSRSMIGGMTVLRPLLNVSRRQLREYLQTIGQSWREDQSNVSLEYARNRVRRMLADHRGLSQAFVELGQSCQGLHQWTSHLPAPAGKMPLAALQDLPGILARERAKKWLIARGASAAELSPVVLDRLIAMACDRATPRRQQFPGGIAVTRKAGFLSTDAYG